MLMTFEQPGNVSDIMVKTVIRVLGSEEQNKKWMPLLDSCRSIGAYAQTELGHGSDVQSLKTEAVYDSTNKQFILNNKSVDSYKWWPGELGVYCDMAIVYAKTIIDGKVVGVYPFIV